VVTKRIAPKRSLPNINNFLAAIISFFSTFIASSQWLFSRFIPVLHQSAASETKILHRHKP